MPMVSRLPRQMFLEMNPAEQKLQPTFRLVEFVADKNFWLSSGRFSAEVHYNVNFTNDTFKKPCTCACCCGFRLVQIKCLVQILEE